jgi:hypothetical protein
MRTRPRALLRSILLPETLGRFRARKLRAPSWSAGSILTGVTETRGEGIEGQKGDQQRNSRIALTLSNSEVVTNKIDDAVREPANFRVWEHATH